MYFFKDDINLKSDHLIPSYNFVCEMKANRDMYDCKVSEVAVGDVLFDIVFLRITEKRFTGGQRPGYHFKALNAEDQGYNAFIFDDRIVRVVNPDYIGELIESTLYSG